MVQTLGTIRVLPRRVACAADEGAPWFPGLARQLAGGAGADNFLRPDELSNFERGQLKNAFGVVQTLQSVLGQRYQAGRF